MKIIINQIFQRKLTFLLFMSINCVILFYIAYSLNYFHSDANREDIFHDDKVFDKQYIPEILWANQTTGDSIILEPLKRDYIDFWFTKSKMEKMQDSLEIKELTETSTHKYIFANLAKNKEENLKTEEVIFQHKPVIKFFSADGKTAMVEDSLQKSIQYKYIDNVLISKKLLQSSYHSVWVFRDGLWKMRQMELKQQEVSKIEPIGEPQFYKVKNGTIFKNGEDIRLKGTNYYPQQQAWDNIWDAYKPKIIEKDLRLMSENGLNSIRVFLPYSKMGGAKVNEKYVQNFKSFLDLCKKYNIYVIPTLFDFFSDYDSSQYTFTDTYMRRIVSVTKDHPNILAWDIKNEPDLDFKLYGQDKVLNWLEYTCIRLNELDKNHFITIGWSNAIYASVLKERINLVSFHFYEKPDQFVNQYLRVEKDNPNKPIVISEFGYSSYESFWYPMSQNTYQQALYYKNMFKEMEKAQVKHFLHWTLYDFPKVPDEVVGSIPWRKKVQQHFGFIDIHGHKKPSFQFINGENSSDKPYTTLQLLNSFHLAFIVGILLFTVIIFTIIKNPKYIKLLKLLLTNTKRILK